MGHLGVIDHVGCNGLFLQQLSFFIPAAITILASRIAFVFLNTRFHRLVRCSGLSLLGLRSRLGFYCVSKNSSAAILYTGFAGGAFLVFSVKKERAYIIFFVLISIMAWITRWGLEDDLLVIMVVSDPLALRYVDLLAVLSVFIILIILPRFLIIFLTLIFSAFMILLRLPRFLLVFLLSSFFSILVLL